ncbi:MAG TPA: Tab2/Atab2 family RNA-binding protein [Thermosynechococcaceae cyanobacterium]
MTVWEIDFYRHSEKDEAGRDRWELLICDPAGALRYRAFCLQAQASAAWLQTQLQQLSDAGERLPKTVRVFRPQTLNLLEPVCATLGIELQPTRRTSTLKRWQAEQPTHSVPLDRLPPVPLPENLWGDRWRFAALPAGDLVDAFHDRPIPVLEMPEELWPLGLGLSSTLPVPGVVIDGGRQSKQLTSWLRSTNPVSLHYISGAPDGLILEAGLVDRWVLTTFEDSDVKVAAQQFEQRKQAAQGLHFLLVQPDDSGMTYSGFWLLRNED